MSTLESKEKDEEKSDNDISELTDQAIFQGALSLLNNGITNNNNQINHNKQQQQHLSQKQQHQLQQLQQSQNNSDVKEEKENPKILQNLTQIDQPNNFAAGNSMYSSGILSFRNKKVKFQMPQSNRNNRKIEENLDPESVTQSILEKINKIKKSKGACRTYANEQKEIDKMLNNDSAKSYEEEYEENDIKVENTNSSQEQCNSDDNYNKGSINDNDEEESNQFFWDLKNDNRDSPDLSNKRKDNYFTQNTSGRKKKRKFLNRIICTLSLLEKGKAIFVSQDDMIFVLPSLFVPKNLSVGNTYVFKVREFEPFSTKSYKIQDIQKKYK